MRSSLKQNMIGAVLNDNNEHKADEVIEYSSSVVQTCLRRVVSSTVVVSYLMLTMSQSFAMQREIMPVDEHDVPIRAKASSLLPFSSDDGIRAPHNTSHIQHKEAKATPSNLLTSFLGYFVTEQKPAHETQRVHVNPVENLMLGEHDVESALTLRAIDEASENGRKDSLTGAIIDTEQTTGKLTLKSNKIHPFELEQTQENPKIIIREEEKETEDSHVKKAGDIEEGNDDDNQSVNSDHSEDSPEAIAKRDKILKDYEARVKDVFKQEMSYLDWALIIAPLVCTGLILQNEIYGEYRLLIDGTLNTFALNSEWYAKIYLEYKNKKGLDIFQNVMLYNAYASLPFYLLDRVSSFFTYLGEGFNHTNLKTKVGYGAATIGLLGVIAAAVNAGAYPAITLYSSDVGFEATKEYAETLWPYLFSFYTVDAFLINSFWKDKAYKYLIVDRKDDPATKLIRQSLLKKLRTTKAVIASMSNDELFSLEQTMIEKLAMSTSKYPSIDAVKELNKSASEGHTQNRRYSVKTRTKGTETQFSIVSFLRNNWTYMLGVGLATGGAYLAFYGSEDKFSNLMHTEVSMKNALPSFDFQQMGIDQAQQASLSGYHAWQDATENVEVFNGNYTDWCWQCLQSADFLSGNIEDGGTFIFKDCPGVSYEAPTIAGPGELSYTHDFCPAMFNHFDQTLAYWAGISTDDYYYTPPLDPLTLTPTQQRLAFAGALLYAVVNAISAAPATKEVIKRVSDSFSNQPEEILPGKRHKLWNAGTLLTAGTEAFVRTAFAAAASWYVLQSTDISQSLLWSIVGLTWISTMMNYIIPLDDAYSKIPVRIGKSVQLTKSSLSKVAATVSENSYVKSIRGYLPDISSYTRMLKSSSVAPETIQEDIEQSTKEESLSLTPLVKRVKEHVAAIPHAVITKAHELQHSMSAAIICDDYIERINKMIGTIENARKDVIEVVHQEMMS